MRHQADDVLGQLRQLADAVPSHPRVELDVDANPFRNLRVGDGELEPRVAHVSDLPRSACSVVAARKRCSCSRANASSQSAVARCVIRPTTFSDNSGNSLTPYLPIPVSSLTWTRIPSGISVSATASSSPASRT